MKPVLLEVNRCKTSNSRSLLQFFWKPLSVISSLWARQSLTNIYKWPSQLGSWMLPFVHRPLRPGSNTMVNTFSQWRTPPESQKHLKLNLHACSCFTGLEKCAMTLWLKNKCRHTSTIAELPKNQFCRTISKVVQKPNF